MKTARALILATSVLWGCGASVECLARPAAGPAPVDDPAVAHVDTQLDGDVCIYEQSWAPSGDARGVVVLVHGLRDHSTRYDELARALVAHGFAVHAADLRGHGRSGGERQFIDSLEVFEADVLETIARARGTHPGVPLFLFGHSMGGAIATLLAIDHPDAIDGLMLSAPALEVNRGTSTFEIGLAHFFAGVAPHIDGFTLNGENFSRDPAVREADEHDPLVIRSAIPARTASALIRAVERVRARGAELSMPLYLIHGDADHVTPPGGTGRLYAHASADDRTFRLYRGLYHDLVHEPERARVIREMVRWLERHTPEDR